MKRIFLLKSIIIIFIFLWSGNIFPQSNKLLKKYTLTLTQELIDIETDTVFRTRKINSTFEFVTDKKAYLDIYKRICSQILDDYCFKKMNTDYSRLLNIKLYDENGVDILSTIDYPSKHIDETSVWNRLKENYSWRNKFGCNYDNIPQPDLCLKRDYIP